MKKIEIAVCDADQAYGERFVTWISLENQDKFLGCCFSEEKPFLEYLQAQRPDIVLLGKGFLGMEGVLEQIQKEEPKGQEGILWMYLNGLAEKGHIPEAAKALPVLDKYQPVSQMVREIFSYYQSYGKKEELLSFRRELIGIYSPGHSIWQTPFALTLAQVLGQQEHVLYVNLKECAGFTEWFQEEYQRDLLDVMYLCLTGKGNVPECIGSAVYHMENFSYIPPAGDSACLGEVLKQDYLKFVKLLAGQSGYGLVILDFGMMVPGFFTLLEECSKVYVLTEPGGLQAASLQHFRQMADRQARPELQQRIDYLTLPKLQPTAGQKGQWLQQWMWGSLGDYARSLMGVQNGAN